MRLKELRLEKQLTQEQVALGIQTGQSNIGRWEREEVLPTSEFIIKLADFFGVSTDYLLGRTDDFGAPVLGNVPQYSAEEQKLIQDYRGLSQPLKDMLQSLIKTWQGQDISHKIQSTRS